MYLDLWWS